MRFPAAALVLALAGCVPAIAGAGAGAAAGGLTAYFASPANDIAAADKVLAADAPLKAAWCKAHPAAQAAHAGLAVYCAHIPTNLLQGAVTWGLVFEAWSRDK